MKEKISINNLPSVIGDGSSTMQQMMASINKTTNPPAQKKKETRGPSLNRHERRRLAALIRTGKIQPKKK